MRARSVCRYGLVVYCVATVALLVLRIPSILALFINPASLTNFFTGVAVIAFLVGGIPVAVSAWGKPRVWKWIYLGLGTACVFLGVVPVVLLLLEG